MRYWLIIWPYGEHAQRLVEMIPLSWFSPSRLGLAFPLHTSAVDGEEVEGEQRRYDIVTR
jgi:hypothetical protein